MGVFSCVLSFGGENFTQGRTAIVLIAPHSRPIRRQAGAGRNKAAAEKERLVGYRITGNIRPIWHLLWANGRSVVA